MINVDLTRLVNCTAVLCTLFVSTNFMDPINLPKLMVLGLGSSFIFIYLVFKIDVTQFKQLIVLRNLLILFSLSMVLTAIYNKQDITRALLGNFGRNNGIFSYISLSILLFASAVVGKQHSGIRIIRAIANLGIVLGFYGIMQMQGADFFNYVYAGRPLFLTLGNEDFASLFLVISICALLYLTIESQSDVAKFFYFLGFMLNTFVLLEIDTAQSKITLIFSLVIFFVYLFKIKNFSHKKNLIIKSILISAGVVLASLGANNLGPFKFVHSNLASLNSRIMKWIEAWDIFKSSPIFGIGVESFGDYQPFYKVLDLNGNPDSYSNNTHNLFFQFLATGGALLLLTYTILICFVLFRMYLFLQSKSFSNAQKSFFLSVTIVFIVNMIVGIDNLGLVPWFWVFSGLIIGFSYQNLESNLSKKSQKISNSESIRQERPKGKIFLGFASLFFLILISFNILSIKENYTSYQLNTYIQKISKDRDNSDTLDSLYRYAKNTSDPDLSYLVIQVLYGYGELENGYKLATRASSVNPRNLSILDAIAIYHENKRELSSALLVRKKMLALDPLNTQIKQKIAALSSNL